MSSDFKAALEAAEIIREDDDWRFVQAEVGTGDEGHYVLEVKGGRLLVCQEVIYRWMSGTFQQVWTARLFVLLLDMTFVDPCYFEAPDAAKAAALDIVRTLVSFRDLPWHECPGWCQKGSGRYRIVLTPTSKRDSDRVVRQGVAYCLRDVTNVEKMWMPFLFGDSLTSAMAKVDQACRACQGVMSHPLFCKEGP